MARTSKRSTFSGDNALLHAVQNPSVNIAGIRHADLLMFSPTPAVAAVTAAARHSA
jgi:hypothetical protein